MKNKLFIFVVLIPFFCGTVFSQSFDKPMLDSLFKALANNNKAMGSLALSKNGVVLYAKAIGYSSINGNEKVPATGKTKYRIGSISKMFTATMIFQLIEEGKLSLATTLDKYFPTVPDAKNITIGNMLGHRSGIHSFTTDTEYTTGMAHPKTKEEILAIISKSKPAFKPDQMTEYSSADFVLLGYIIEAICMKPYKEVLAERITSKTGLMNTYCGGKTDIKNNESHSYKYVDNAWQQEPETDLSNPGDAGAIVSTPTDLTKFITALFDGKLMSQSSLLKMKTITDGYGMGMFQGPFYDKMWLGHTGVIDGFSSVLYYFAGDSLAVAYCSNGQVYDMNNILIGALSIYFNRPYNIPTFKTLRLSSSDLDKYLGVYSSTQIPLKITIAKEGETLMAQVNGQSSFPLEAIDKDKFAFDQAGIVMEFDMEKNQLTLKQGGGQTLFTKEQ